MGEWVGDLVTLLFVLILDLADDLQIGKSLFDKLQIISVGNKPLLLVVLRVL